MTGGNARREYLIQRTGSWNRLNTYNLQHISVWNLGTSDIFNIIHRYELTKNEENSRTSSFEESTSMP